MNTIVRVFDDSEIGLFFQTRAEKNKTRGGPKPDAIQKARFIVVERTLESTNETLPHRQNITTT